MLDQITLLTEQALDYVWDLCQRYPDTHIAILSSSSNKYFIKRLFKALETQESHINKTLLCNEMATQILFDNNSLIRWRTIYNFDMGTFDFVLYAKEICDNDLLYVKSLMSSNKYDEIVFAEEIGNDIRLRSAKELL